MSLQDADSWMRLWSRRLRSARFSLLGGELTIHPQLVEFVALSRRHWPAAQLQVVTNGLLLHHLRNGWRWSRTRSTSCSSTVSVPPAELWRVAG